jgi:hypothetical protein
LAVFLHFQKTMLAQRLRLFRALALVTGAFLLLVHSARAQGVSPSLVVYRFEHAWAQHDLETALGQLADDATITLQDSRTRSLRGPEQIREFLTAADLQSVPVLTSTRQVDGISVSWSERTERQGQVLGGTDVTVQAIVRDGKIQSLVYRPGTMVRSVDRAGPEVTPESAIMALGALLLLGLGLLSLATVGSHARAGSNLRGRLHHDLHHWRRARA